MTNDKGICSELIKEKGFGIVMKNRCLGMMAIFFNLFLFVFCFQLQATENRKLIICADGLPYSEISGLYERGYFRTFKRPSRFIAPFPSLSAVGVADIFQIENVQGYQDSYYDIREQLIVGGVFGYYLWQVPNFSYEKFNFRSSMWFFDLREHLDPSVISRRELEEFLGVYVGITPTHYIAYLGATDALFHREYPLQTESFLQTFDQRLSQLQEKNRDLEIIIVSDHGHSLTESKRIDLAFHLAGGGFIIEERVRSAESVILPTMGLVGAATIFTMEENEDHVARISASVEGVDLSFYEENGSIFVYSYEGGKKCRRATIEKRGEGYRYRSLEGDPLGYLPLVETLKVNGEVDSEGFSDRKAWFDVSKNHIYPDALERIDRSLTTLVQNPANVLVSIKPGYYWGHSVGSLVVNIRSTHGSLDAAQSSGVFMSSQRELPMYLRSFETQDLLLK